MSEQWNCKDTVSGWTPGVETVGVRRLMLVRMLSAIVPRAIRFYVYGSLAWLILPGVACLVALIAMRRVELYWTLGSLLLGFLIARCFATAIVRNLRWVDRPLFNWGMHVPVVLALLLRFSGFFEHGVLALCALSGIWFGCVFWAITDPMYDMVNWLAFPTEWGRWPDDIRLFDRRRMVWEPGEDPIECRIYRFRYDDEWDYGLWGPVTFASSAEGFEGQSAEQIYAFYSAWYHGQDIGTLMREAADSDADD